MEECKIEWLRTLGNEFLVYVSVVTFLLLIYAISIFLFRFRWYQQLWGLPNNPVGPMMSFAQGLLLGILFVHANQMIPFQTLSHLLRQ